MAVLRRSSEDVEDDGVNSQHGRESPRASLGTDDKGDPKAPGWAKRLAKTDWYLVHFRGPSCWMLINCLGSDASVVQVLGKEKCLNNCHK